jgi:hypothetical protein
MAISSTIRQSRVTAGCLVLLVLGILVSIGMCALGTFSGAEESNGQEQVSPVD